MGWITELYSVIANTLVCQGSPHRLHDRARWCVQAQRYGIGREETSAYRRPQEDDRATDPSAVRTAWSRAQCSIRSRVSRPALDNSVAMSFGLSAVSFPRVGRTAGSELI